MSDVCIKRKFRNRMQDLGMAVFIQSEDKPDWDGKKSLKERADAMLPKLDSKNQDEYAKKACGTWMDVRSFGQLFAFSDGENKKGSKSKTDSESKKESISIGIRGPVSIHHAISVSPVDIRSFQITKSVNGNPNDKKASDTMGMKHFVRFGLYEIKGSINVQLAEKTGFTDEDAEIIKECLRTLFVNDASSARPDGSMEVVKVFWFKHNCKDGQYSSAKVHRSLHVKLKDESAIPTSPDDYEITLDPLDGLDVEIIDGI
jgi:CRISPR-associated protein Csd2